VSAVSPAATRPVLAPRQRVDLPAALLLVLLCACWGLQQVTVKLAADGGLPPVLQAGLRSLIAVLCLGAWQAARGRLRTLTVRDGTYRLGALIAACFALEFVLMFVGLTHTSASRGVVILYTTPFFVALGGHFCVPGERIGRWQVAGLVLAFGGVAVAMLHRPAGGGATLLGDGLVLASAVAWAATTLIIKATRLARVPAAKVLFYQLAGSVPLLFAISAAIGESWAIGPATPLAWLALAYQSLVVAFATYLAWFWLITRYPAGLISAFTFLTPLFGILAGAALLGETLSASLLLAFACVAIGLRLVNRRSR